jgi:hypothetical protein
MTRKIGVGIVGVTPGRSWAAIAHIPALRALSDRFEVVALSTTKQSSADAAAKQFDVPEAYDNHALLVSNPRVDLVVVTVKVPAHFELVAPLWWRVRTSTANGLWVVAWRRARYWLNSRRRRVFALSWDFRHGPHLLLTALPV